MDKQDFKFDKEATLIAKKLLEKEEDKSQNQDFTSSNANDETSNVRIEAQDDVQKDTDVKCNEKADAEDKNAPEGASDNKGQKADDVKGEQTKCDKTQSGHSLGKFKDPQELLRAYEALEKEFTRRSQRLKELERSVAPYASEEEWREAADKFFQKAPSAKALAREMAQEIALDPTLKDGRDCFDKALLRALVKCYRTPEQMMSDGQFLNDYVLCSNAVKEAVIANYLREVQEGEPPLTLPRGGQSSAAPSQRPRSVREAGDMLLRENK